MTTTVTVPGASGTYIPNPYNTPYNSAVAQQISSVLFEDQQNDTLFVQNSDESPQSVPAGDVGEIAVTVVGGGVINVPKGYTFTAIDQTVSGPVTINGGGSLFAGNQTVTYYGAPASGTVSIAAGDANDLIALPNGSTYVVALGNGNDTIFANGSGTVTGGSGNNIFFAGSAGGENDVNSYGSADTIVAGQGAVTVHSYGANPLIYGGSGSLVYLGGAAGNPTITGGSGTETLFGSAGQNIDYTDGSNTTPGANILAAGAGNETLDAGSAKYGVQIAIGSGSVDVIGSAAGDTIYGGSGAATITTNGGSDLFVFGDLAGHTGGTDLITDFDIAKDTINLTGLTVSSETSAGTSPAMIMLSDDTRITFSGISDPTKININ
jgi:Ca2+-binding RTX toxin-like protein